MLTARGRRQLRYDVEPDLDRWTLGEDQVPESRSHDQLASRLSGLLVHRLRETGRRAQVGRNLAIRFDENHPQIGVDPDVYVLEPPAPEGDDLMSLRLWEPGHARPPLVVEIVSPSRPGKDYSESPRSAFRSELVRWYRSPGSQG